MHAVGRREFISLLGGAAAAAFVRPLTAAAQQRASAARIGVLIARPANDPQGQKQAAAFQRGLDDLGWSLHRNIEIEYRWTAGDAGMTKAFARELVDWRPDILVVGSTPSLITAREVASGIPIVFVAITDPVAQGFVQSLARPGGNMTGFVAEEVSMGAKWVQLLNEIAPRVGPIAVIFNPNSAPFAHLYLPVMAAARPSSAGELIASTVNNESELENAIAAASRQHVTGLIFLPDSFLSSRHEMITALVAKQGLPAIYYISDYVRNGGLIAYGIERADLFRRSAAYVDRILKGEKAADLPVQTATKFELIINLKAAQALGLTVPAGLLVAADEVIE